MEYYFEQLLHEISHDRFETHKWGHVTGDVESRCAKDKWRNGVRANVC